MTTEHQTLLIQDLKRFGLNPQDWLLQRTSSLEFQIRHTDDTDFVLQGKCSENFFTQWESISLESF